MPVDVLGQLAEEHAEERREQGSGEIQTLRSKVISVVQLPPLQRREQEPVDHVPEEVGLLRVLSLRHRHMREHLLLKDLLRVVDAPFASESCDRSPATDKVESNLNREAG